MSISNVCPTEDAVQAFLEFLVDPMLPKKLISDTPDKPEAVAKQVHAVVLLYNYYHRKRHADLEFLDFEPFCKLALLLKPTLMPHMKLMLRTDDTEVINLEKQLSLTEKAVMDACDISRSLYASISVPSEKRLPVSKISVLLIDKTKKNCILLSGSITQGVKSLIEKDVNESCCGPDGSVKAKQMSKRKRTPNKRLRDESDADECHFQQLAFSAIKEATKDGISQSDLTIIESHVVCSLSKVKTAARFYIVQCAREAKARWIPIKDVIQSLQGPLVKKDSSGWVYSPVVEYFHLLPYARIISQWYSRDVSLISFEEPEYVQEVINVHGFEMIKDLCEPEVQNNGNRIPFDGGIVEASKNSSCAESEKQNEKNVHCMNDFFDDNDGPSWTMDVDNHSTVHFEKKLTSENVAERVQHDSQLKKINSHAECELNGRTDIAKFDVVNSAVRNNLNQLKDQIDTNGKAASNDRPAQDGISLGNHTPVICKSRSKFSAKLQKAIASKENILSETALRVLLRKRDKMVLQLRNIGDEIAQCDQKMQTILNGGEDDLELKIELIIEGYNDASRENQGLASQGHEGLGSSQCKKRNRSSEEACSKANPCQLLDGICKGRNWTLPTYQVFPSDGGYQAKVTVKGTDFESSSEGNACQKPHEARSSAASRLLVKLVDHV
ncbi:uncharacterized protein LOC120192131 [Hibiscus syriacus]|uniref:uncharacterized protein LOC120192131 n=1 Tax=Hibiscus syriacus TaxID=106335 RepID=UPI001924412E|nr:uncharacterized protein LOC120192131 [Hibiscus syriacus]